MQSGVTSKKKRWVTYEYFSFYALLNDVVSLKTRGQFHIQTELRGY